MKSDSDTGITLTSLRPTLSEKNLSQQAPNTKKPMDLELKPVPSIPETFEEILEKLGCFGPFQALTMFLYLFLEIMCAFLAFIPIFVARSEIPENCTFNEENNIYTTASTDSSAELFDYTISYSEENFYTTVSTSTDFFSFKSIIDSFHQMMESPFKHKSIVDEWDLRCDRSRIPAIFTSIMMFGMAIGGLLTSQLADWYGRRRPLVMTLVQMAIGTLLCALSPSIYIYAIGRFISGCGFSGYFIISTMAVMEFMTPQWRSIANCVGPIGEGIVVLSVLGYFVRSWRLLYLVTLTPLIFIIPIYMYLPESPRWLLNNGKTDEAYKVLCYMAKVNNRPPISIELLHSFKRQEQLAQATESQKNKRISYLEFIKNRVLLKTSLYLFCLWFSWNMSYYGLMYNLTNVPGNPYINLGLVGFANAIGQRVSFTICDRLGRQRGVLATMSFSASFLVSMAICFLTLESVDAKILLIGCFFGLMGLASSRALIRLLCGESFPTAVRMMGLCCSGLGANISGLITPQLVFLGAKYPPVPFFIFAGISVVGSFVVFMMKETTGNPLTDNIQDIEDKEKPKV